MNLLFCSPRYDLDRLARRIAASFSGPIIACTTAGQLGEAGFQKGGITAVSLTSSELLVSPYLITPLAECQARASEAAFTARSGLFEHGSERAFGMVLVDGLSRAEERLAASLYQSLGTIPLIGGCAGDQLSFEGTYVYHEGKFLRDAALFALFETTLPFTTFKVQHTHPGKHKLVVTMADPEQRLVHEFNGEPAAEAYAEALGVEVDELDALFFAKNPVIFQSGGEHYVRSIKSLGADFGLVFFSGLEVGQVLSVGDGIDEVQALQRGFDAVRDKIGTPQVILGCDGTRYRSGVERDDTDARLSALMARNAVAGFSSYGQQYNALYVNQTFSAVALSGA
ncbi:MAG: FIST N-terminal domain-containing protein [Polyangiaceae bacterium]